MKVAGKPCIFCGSTDTEGHHVLPKSVKKVMRWSGKKHQYFMAYKVPVCEEHHGIVTSLLEPLVWVICELRNPQLSLNLITVLDNVMSRYGGWAHDKETDE